MKIYIGADHRGFGPKKKIIAMLEQLGHKAIDLGTYTDQQPCDYPDIAKDVGERVAAERESRGILVCMSGIGLTIAANKIKGVYAALCHNVESAELSRLHNNANVLVLSSKFVDDKDIFQMLETWLTTSFEGGRHLPRVKKIMDMEEHFSGAEQPKAAAPVQRPERPQEIRDDRPRESREDRGARSEKYERGNRRENFKGEQRPYSGNRRDRDERPRPSSRSESARTERPSYSARKPAYRKDEGRSFSGPKKNFSRDNERSYARTDRPAGRGSSGGKRPYSGGRSDERPSYAQRKPDARMRSGRADRAHSDARPERRDKPGYRDDRAAAGRERPAYSKDRPRDDRPEKRGERKPFVSGKPKFSSKPFSKGSPVPRKKFQK